MQRRCPECGQSVKEENLAAHLGKVHPKVSPRKYGDLKIQKPRGARRRLPGWVPYAVVFVAVTVGAGLYFASTGPKSLFYASHDSYDFGKVPQATVNHSFTFENRGEVEMRVWGLTSSCDCTAGHVIIGGVQGPHLGMHLDSPWVGTVSPGMTGTLVAMYDATQMPDRYEGTRQLYLQTNDPAHSTVTFTIHVDEGP